MFTGIIESTSHITSVQSSPALVRIQIRRPESFTDVKPGDSIAVNGVCLTVEALSAETIQFALAYETLKVLDLKPDSQDFDWNQSSLNLERSLKFGGRVDGHFVTGHVDSRVQLIKLDIVGESWILKFELPEELKPYVWRKGSCALNGVSLTINEVESDWFSVCLIPETLKRTNFSEIKIGDKVNFEVDYLARAIVHNLKLRNPGGL